MSKELYLNYKYIWQQCDNTMDSLFAYIQQYPSIVMDSYGNITVKNTLANKPLPVFCCHLDTVHGSEPSPTLIKDDVLISFNGHGIGGDDKCGIIACLELLQKVECKCIFFRDEEKGCLGSKEYDTKTLKNDLFCIEIDRRNACDLIVKSGGASMCSKEFLDRVKEALPHCKEADGLFTDVSRLGDAEINMLNISSGYYQPHTDKEYVVLSELQANIDGLAMLANNLVKKPLKTTVFKRKGEYKYVYTEKAQRVGCQQPKQHTFWEDDRNDADYNALEHGYYGGRGSDDYPVSYDNSGNAAEQQELKEYFESIGIKTEEETNVK